MASCSTRSGKKNPLNLCIAAEAAIGMAGVLRERIGSKSQLGKVFTASSTLEYVTSQMRAETKKPQA